MADKEEKIRPRLTREELVFILSALELLEQSAKFKLKEIEFLPFELKQFARFLWFSGDVKAYKMWKPYREYVLTELPKDQDFCKIMLNAQVLRRRIEGLLEGKRLHSEHFWRE